MNASEITPPLPISLFAQAYGCDTYGGGDYGQCATATNAASSGTNSAAQPFGTNPNTNQGTTSTNSATRATSMAKGATGTTSGTMHTPDAIPAMPNVGLDWALAISGLIVLTVAAGAVIRIVGKERKRKVDT